MSGIGEVLPYSKILGIDEERVFTNTTESVIAQHPNGDYWQDPSLIPYPTERFGPLETALIGDPSRT